MHEINCEFWAPFKTVIKVVTWSEGELTLQLREEFRSGSAEMTVVPNVAHSGGSGKDMNTDLKSDLFTLLIRNPLKKSINKYRKENPPSGERYHHTFITHITSLSI